MTKAFVETFRLEDHILTALGYCIRKIADELLKKFHPNDRETVRLLRQFCTTVNTRNKLIKQFQNDFDQPLHADPEWNKTIDSVNRLIQQTAVEPQPEHREFAQSNTSNIVPPVESKRPEKHKSKQKMNRVDSSRRRSNEKDLSTINQIQSKKTNPHHSVPDTEGSINGISTSSQQPFHLPENSKSAPSKKNGITIYLSKREET